MTKREFLLRTGFVIAGIVTFLVILSTICYLVLLYQPLQQKILHESSPLYENVLEGKLSVGSIRTNLLTFAVIENVTVTDTTNKENRISADKIEVNFWLPSLLFREINLRLIKADNVTINTVMPENRKYFFPGVPSSVYDSTKKKADKESSWTVSIGRVEIENLDASYIDSGEKIFGYVKNASVNIRFPKIDSLEANLTSDSGKVASPWWNGLIDTIKIQTIIDSTGFFIKNVNLQGDGTTIHAAGKVPYTAIGRWNVDIRGVTRLNSVIRDLSLARSIQKGTVYVKGKWQGTIRNPVLELNLTSTDTQIEHIPFTSIEVSGTYKNNIADIISRFESDNIQGMVLSGITITQLFTEAKITNYAAGCSLSLNKLYKLKNIIPALNYVDGNNIKLKLDANGYGLSIPDQANLFMSGFLGRRTKEPFQLTGKYANQLWNVNGSLGKNTFYGNGNVHKNMFVNGNLKAHVPDPGSVTRNLFGESVQGELDLVSVFSRSREQVYVNVTAQSKNLQWRSLQAFDLNTALSLNGNKLSIDRCTFSLHGSIDSSLEYFRIDSTGGEITCSVIVTGTLPDIYSRVNFTGKDIYYKRYRVQEVSGHIESKTLDTINLGKISLTSDRSQIITDAAMIRKDLFEIKVTIQNQMKKENNDWSDAGKITSVISVKNNKLNGTLTCSDLNLESVVSWLPDKVPVKGYLSSTSDITGSLKYPAVCTHFEIIQPGYEKMTLQRVHGFAEIMDSLLISESKINITDTSADLSLSVKIPFRPGDKWSVDTVSRERYLLLQSDTMRFSEFALDPDSTLLFSGDAKIDFRIYGYGSAWLNSGDIYLSNGRVSSLKYDFDMRQVITKVSLEGFATNPKFTFDVQSTEADLNKITLKDIVLRGSFRDKMLQIDSSYVHAVNGGTINVNGAIPIVSGVDSVLNHFNTVLNYTITDISLRILEPFIQGVYVNDGVLNGAGQVIITDGRMRSNGTVALSKGFVETDFIEQAVGPFDGTFVFHDDSLIIQRLNGKIKDGRFDISGRCILISRENIDVLFNLTGEDIQLDMPEIAQIQARTVKLQFKNREDRVPYLLSGGIAFDNARFIRDVQIDDLIRLSQPAPAGIRKIDQYEKIALQIFLEFQDNLFVDMNLGNVQLEGNLTMAGTLAKPTFAGEVQTVQGEILYLDRQFTVTKGIVNFITPTELNPRIDIESNTEVNTISEGNAQPVNYIIYLKVKGDLEHPLVTLSSEPELDQPDIISMLTLGTTLGSVGRDISSRIGSLIGKEFLGFGTRRLERLLGLQNVTITGNLFGPKQQGREPRLSLTKRVSPRLSLSYETALNTLNQQKISIIYRLFPFLFLIGQTDNRGDANINMRFRFNR